MSKEKFKKYTEFKNARNLVAGTINSKVPNKDIVHDIDFIAYEVIEYDGSTPNTEDQFKILQKLGFITPYNIICDSITPSSLNSILEKYKSNYIVDIDGVVVTSHGSFKREERNPRHSIAWKILDINGVETTIKDVVWEESRYGTYKPVALIEPIKIDGVQISRATAHNAKFVQDNGIGIGSVVEVARSGDVIPKIIKIIKKSTPKFPSKYEWNETGVEIYNSEGSANQEIKQIAYSLKVLEVDGISEKKVKVLYDNGFNTLDKILSISESDVDNIEGFGKKSASNLVNNIKIALNSVTIEKLMVASNCFEKGFAMKTAKLIVSNVDITNTNKDEILAIKGIGAKSIDNIMKGLDKFNKYLSSHNFKFNKQTEKTGKIYVLSGTRNKEIIDLINSQGGTIEDNVTKRTDYVIYKKGNVTGKMKQASKYKIPIMTEEEFLQ